MYRKANGLDEFYSRTKAKESVELFIDLNGNPTIDYPHVHIVHKQNGNVDVIASYSKGNHIWQTTLIDPDGKSLAHVITQARDKIIDKIKEDREILTGDLESKIEAFINDDAVKYRKEVEEKMYKNILHETMKKGLDEEAAIKLLEKDSIKEAISNKVGEFEEVRRQDMRKSLIDSLPEGDIKEKLKKKHLIN